MNFRKCVELYLARIFREIHCSFIDELSPRANKMTDASNKELPLKCSTL